MDVRGRKLESVYRSLSLCSSFARDLVRRSRDQEYCLFSIIVSQVLIALLGIHGQPSVTETDAL